MTTIRQHAAAYLAMRRQLGFKLTTFGQKLMSFVAYLERTDAPVLTTAAAVAWATETPRSTDPVHWSRRLMVVRIFARHLHVLEPATDVPPMMSCPTTTGGCPRICSPPPRWPPCSTRRTSSARSFALAPREP